MAVTSAAGLLAPAEYPVTIRMIGIACGSHLKVDPPYIEVEPGSWIVVQNESPWRHEIGLNRQDGPADAVQVSSLLEPGDTWRVRVPREPGDYYITSTDPWHYMAGLRGRIHVR